MKKVLALVAAVMLLGGTAMAQASFGVGYMNPTHISLNDSNMNGCYVGFDYNIHLSDNFGIAPGVYASYAHKAQESTSVLGSGKVALSEVYVGVPVNLNYSLKLAPDFALSLYAGPTLAYGVMSKSKGDINILGIGGSTEGNLYDGTNYKPLDLLVGGGVAFDYAEMFRVSIGYNYGILDRDSRDNGTYNRNYLHMGIAYLF